MLPSVVKNKIEQIWLDVIAGGVSQPTEVIEQLTYLMFAKQIDEREADIEMAELLSGEKQSHIFGESREEQALRWRNFKGMEARALHKHFVDRVFIFLINLNSNENSAFSRYLKHATFKINEPLALQKVVAGLEDLFENDIKDLDMQGDLYEYMLGKLNSAGRLGAFRTPKHIRDMMVKLMMPTPDMKICDPACGTAGFLISSAEYIRSEYGNKMTAEQWEKYGSETFTGFDTDETMCRLSCMNLMLHSVINPQLNKQDSVSKDYQVKDAYDLILANPPFKGTPFGLLIRKIAKMDRTAAYAAFSTFILEERPNTEQLHFIEQVVDYVVENGYINNVLDLMKTPFDRPYKFSLIFTYEEQVKFVKIINNIKNNALVT